MNTQHSNTSTVPPLTRRTMSDEEVLNLITPYYPMYAPLHFFETKVFELLESWCDDYDGGMWKYYELSNGAWYLAPDASKPLQLRDVNGRKHAMTPDGAGLAASLHLLHQLSWHFHEKGEKAKSDIVSEHYHALRMYTYAHVDVAAIWKVLD